MGHDLAGVADRGRGRTGNDGGRGSGFGRDLGQSRGWCWCGDRGSRNSGELALGSHSDGLGGLL